MNFVASRLAEICSHFQASTDCQDFASTNDDAYVAYYNSMYLLQDSTESLLRHRERGFSSDPLLAYLEFWGVLQAAIIQQDSIAELHQVFFAEPFSPVKKGLQAWTEVRELRNTCAGHPAKKDRPNSLPLTRSFMGRGFGSYQTIVYERWRQGVGLDHPKVPLGALLDEYAREAELQLGSILSAMRARWP